MKNSIILEHGCIFVFGDSVALSTFAHITKTAPKGAVISPHLARLSGALLACGTPDDISKATEKYLPVALARMEVLKNNDPQLALLGEDALRWLAIGEQGLSSCALFLAATGHKPAMLRDENLLDYPRDPDDLRRCRLLLEAVPSIVSGIRHLQEKQVPVWRVLIGNWDLLCFTMDEECPNWRVKASQAPKTFAIMQELIDSCREG